LEGGSRKLGTQQVAEAGAASIQGEKRSFLPAWPCMVRGQPQVGSNPLAFIGKVDTRLHILIWFHMLADGGKGKSTLKTRQKNSRYCK
jgi:hypothetical protein